MSAQKDSLRERIIAAIKRQKRPTVTILSSLLAVQDEIGYIPQQAIEEVAVRMNTSNNEVFGVASFYPNFRLDPPSDHTIEVCWGPSCHLVGATEVIKSVLDELELDGEGDTTDKIVTFKFNTCLGACPQAPVMSINHRMYGKVSAKQAQSHVSSLRENAKGAS